MIVVPVGRLALGVDLQGPAPSRSRRRGGQPDRGARGDCGSLRPAAAPVTLQPRWVERARASDRRRRARRRLHQCRRCADGCRREGRRRRGRIASISSRINWLSSHAGSPVSCAASSRARQRRFAVIGDRRSGGVPAGVYARRYLEKAKGLWAAYEPRIVPTTNVRAALAAVETGGADAAIVYVTDLVAATRGAALAIPAADGPRIVYPGALLAVARAEAKRFLRVSSAAADATAIFIRHKFVVPHRGQATVVERRWTSGRSRRFTLVTALAATALMVPPGLALAWLLARRRFRGRVLVETFVSLPLVMPPVATGSSCCCSSRRAVRSAAALARPASTSSSRGAPSSWR